MNRKHDYNTVSFDLRNRVMKSKTTINGCYNQSTSLTITEHDDHRSMEPKEIGGRSSKFAGDYRDAIEGPIQSLMSASLDRKYQSPSFDGVD